MVGWWPYFFKSPILVGDWNKQKGTHVISFQKKSSPQCLLERSKNFSCHRMVGMCWILTKFFQSPFDIPLLFDGNSMFSITKKGGLSRNIWHAPLLWQPKFFGCHKEVWQKKIQSPQGCPLKIFSHRMIGDRNPFSITIYNVGCLNVNGKFPTSIASMKMDANVTLDTKWPCHISFDNLNVCKLLGIYRLGCFM
jgi:hypothetical protein